jgi:hypothetical protein
MDPDAALARIRHLADTNNCEDARDCYLDLAELVQGLDEWITKGGFLPKAWQKQNGD